MGGAGRAENAVEPVAAWAADPSRANQPLTSPSSIAGVGRPRERVARFALVEAKTGAPTQLGIAVPAEHEERSFYSADVPQGHRQSVLSWISGQLFQQCRGLDRARSNRRREAKDFAPVGGDMISVDKPANEL